MEPFTLETLSLLGTSEISQLADVLVDCVEGGASVSFMAPLSRDKAIAFWASIDRGMRLGERVVVVARSDDGTIVGCVQLVLDLPENQPHRADISKMLVHRAHRRKGIARALMTEIERVAAAHGRSLLVLDTANDGAEDLYRKAGWIQCGVIPDYALFPDGRPCATTIMYRRLK
jgi:ribosomal protein S18 acetylase RimI-like enzyme